MVGLVIVVIIVCVILYLRFGHELRDRAKVRAERREQFNNPWLLKNLPPFAELPWKPSQE